EVAKKSLEKAAECVRCLEEDMAKARERVKLQEFSLGSCPPSVGLQGMRWSTIGDQRVLKLGLEWDTNEMSILMLAKPLNGPVFLLVCVAKDRELFSLLEKPSSALAEDFSEFIRFYDFVFFMCRENGQKNI
ncbi:hypothetical protein S245_013100, partial [Arachis hypogaea]